MARWTNVKPAWWQVAIATFCAAMTVVAFAQGRIEEQWTWWLGLFLVMEVTAATNHEKGDTFSERVWGWFGIRPLNVVVLWRVPALAQFLVVLTLHLVLGGAYWWCGGLAVSVTGIPVAAIVMHGYLGGKVMKKLLAVFVVAAGVVALPFCTGLADRDGDGVPDAIDMCPDVPGPLENLGCPLPTGQPFDCDAPESLSGFVPVKHPITDRYIVVMKRTQQIGPQSVGRFAASLKGVTNVKTLSHGFAATIARESIAEVLTRTEVQYVQQEGTKTIDALSWGLDRVDQRQLPLDKVFAPGSDGENIHIYVNDTGVTRTADLGDRLSNDCFSTITFKGCEDGHGHGTHVSGTAAGTTWGIAKKAIVHSVRFLDSNGSGSDSDAVRSLDWIAQHPGGGVVNASWGGSASPAVDEAVCRVIASGKVFVAAAGNESGDAYLSSPANVVQALTVGATDKNDKQAYFSNFGPGVDLYAPGVAIESDTPTGGTAVYDGTSMATPHVVGAVALEMQRHPEKDVAGVVAAIVTNATPGVLGGLGEGSPNLLLYVKEGQ